MAAASPKLIVSAAATDGTASQATNRKILPRTMGTSQPMILLVVKGHERCASQCPRHCCPATGASHPFHKTVDHLLLAGLLEGDGELVAIDLHDMAVAELLVEDAVIQREFGNRGGFRHQLALDHHGAALVAREARRKRRLVLAETAAGLAAAVAGAIGLGTLPARRGVAGAERFDIVEARGAVAATAAPAGAAL